MRITCVFLLALSGLRAQFPGRESDGPRNPLAGRPEAIQAGSKLFTNSCGGCHGGSGQGGRGPNLVEGRRIRRLTDPALFTSIKSGVPGTDMPPTNLPDDRIWELVAFVRDLSAPAYESKLPGDPDAGSALFYGKAGCSGCHMIRGQGGFLGPDLTNAGAERSAPQLRESIVKPNARIAGDYEAVTATTLDGAKIAGVARNHDGYSLQILDAKGELHLLSKDKLRNLEFRKTSLMPDDYSQRLSADEISNLIAFLARQSVRPAPGRGLVRAQGSRR